MNCPKCGFEQQAGAECLRCGIVFERYGLLQDRGAKPERGGTVELEQARPAGIFRRFYRVFRWVALAGTVAVILLALRQPPPPYIHRDPDAPERLREKLREMSAAAQAGRPYTLRMDEAELNNWLGSNLALTHDSVQKPRQPGAESGDSMDTSRVGNPDAEEPQPTVEEVQSSVRDVKISLRADRLSAFVRFDLHGKDLTLVLEGRLLVVDGYLRLQPTGMKLGSLPIPRAMVDSAVRRLFESPENIEKFKLPSEIVDIRLENSEMVVTRR